MQPVQECLCRAVLFQGFVVTRTLPPAPNWSPYILTLVQKVKIGHKN